MKRQCAKENETENTSKVNVNNGRDTVESHWVKLFWHHVYLQLIRRSRHLTYTFLKKLIVMAPTTRAGTTMAQTLELT